MNRKLWMFVLSGLLLVNRFPARAGLISTNSTLGASIILIEPSSTMVGGLGKATLTIGVLKRAGGSFFGNYQVKVSPYSFKNEKGHLAILLSDDGMKQIAGGTIVTVTGSATNSDNGKIRAITATATPTNGLRGML